MERRFLATDTVALLYHFAGAQDLKTETDDILITTNFPKRVYEDREMTLEAAQLTPNAIVFVVEKLVE
jgi:hypothetical protein